MLLVLHSFVLSLKSDFGTSNSKIFLSSFRQVTSSGNKALKK